MCYVREREHAQLKLYAKLGEDVNTCRLKKYIPATHIQWLGGRCATCHLACCAHLTSRQCHLTIVPDLMLLCTA